MGIIRKTMSLGTMGLVSYRNDEEKARKLAKQQRNAARVAAAAGVVNAREVRKSRKMEEESLALQKAELEKARLEAELAVLRAERAAEEG